MKLVQVHENPTETVQVVLDGNPLRLPGGMSVAAALLAVGVGHFRDAPTRGAPRGPLCMMGVCFDCLMIIDGIANCQACMIEPAEGMVIARQDRNAGAMG